MYKCKGVLSSWPHAFSWKCWPLGCFQTVAYSHTLYPGKNHILEKEKEKKQKGGKNKKKKKTPSYGSASVTGHKKSSSLLRLLV